MKSLLLAELRNGPGTCTDIWQRLTAAGVAASAVQVQQALQSLADSGIIAADESVPSRHMTRREALEGGIVTYSVADGGIWKEVG